MKQEEKLLAAEEQKLLDRPAEERLKEELEVQRRDGKPPITEKRRSRRGLILVFLLALALIAGIFLLGYLPRRAQEKAAESQARREATSLPVVNVVRARRSPGESHLLLPANITPIVEAPLFARATGYVAKRMVDIGDRVRPNQLMATIDAPDLDQQVMQGRASLSQARQQLGQVEAALNQAKSQRDLAKITWDRYAALVTRGAVSRQDADQQKTTYETAEAAVHLAEANVRAAQDNVQAAAANLERLIALQSYKEVRAPFAGVVTARNVDVGSFITSNGGSSGATTYSEVTSLGSGSAASGTEMFRVAQLTRLRTLINVPQTDAPTVQVGQTADLMVEEFRGQKFRGRVARSANAIDPATRTLLTEVEVENPKQQLLPGMYSQIQIVTRRANPPVLVPGDSIVTRAAGVMVAILVDPQAGQTERAAEREGSNGQDLQKAKRVHFQKIEIGRDYGTDTEIVAGLRGGEYVITNPGDDVYEGALVIPKLASPAQGATPAGGATDKRPGGAPGSASSTGAQSKDRRSGNAGQSGR
jgi:multidrug efflux pump subunit AcrA (membrane-fusion protein)